MTRMQTIGFVGAGNMNGAIIGGLINSGFDPANIKAADPNNEKLENLHATYGVSIAADNQSLAVESDILIIGVKPNHVTEVCAEIAPISQGKLIVSIAAGITLTQLESYFDEGQAVIRAMPNTPCLIAEGAIGLCANQKTTRDDIAIVSELFKTTGEVEIIADEQQMDLVTALSGSGPAYFFYIAEAMLAEAHAQGLSDEQAENLIYSTMSGAAKMLKQSELSAQQLRRNVTSPGGTTAAALATLEKQNVAMSFREAIRSAVKRGRELAE